MKFLVDAQLPRQLAFNLQIWGYEATHTLDLRYRNQSPDTFINTLSHQEQRVLISKDADFVTDFIRQQGPYKLLLVATGSLANEPLLALIARNLTQICAGFGDYDFIELSPTQLIFRE